MSMSTWAENEIKIACERERAGSTEDGEWDYGCACYESALKAFKSLMDDGHSGYSISITKAILNRLIEGKPLTPIEDTDDIWNDITDMSGLRGEEINYQCKRMSSLFKYVYADGSIKYYDVNRCYCQDINDPRDTFGNGFIQRLYDEKFPITMPYNPEQSIKIVCESFLVYENNGDYDTTGVFYAIKPNGEKVEINRFFKDGDDNTFIEIDGAEYNERKKNKINKVCSE